MNLQFTAVLIVGAVASFAFMLRKIRKSEISIADSTFWFLFSLSLVLLAVFPQIARLRSRLTTLVQEQALSEAGSCVRASREPVASSREGGASSDILRDASEDAR